MTSVVDPAGKIQYSCGKCKREQCKLWRDYQTFLENQSLICAKCIGEPAETIDDDGRVISKITGGRTDQIGWLVPAVPTPDYKTFWGYTSVPEKDVKWWRSLQN